MHLLANFPLHYPSLATALAVALAMFFFLRRARNNLLSIPEIKPAANGKTPDCMVVIPARNEEALIARAVKSLPHDSVIVVDDSSTDKTADAARTAGAGVLKAPKLGFGVFGKPSACSEGARVLTSRWILFADADAWFEPGFVEAAVVLAESEKSDFLSIHLQPAYETASAKVIGPLAQALIFSGFHRKDDPAELFNGQCILARRNPYEFIGGHRSVAKFMEDDLKLAALAKRHRMRYAVARAYPLGHATIQVSDFVRAAHRYEGPRFWMGVRIFLAGITCALWLPALIWLIVNRQYFAAVLFAAWPSALMGFWYGWPQALLAPMGIYAALPVLFQGTVNTLTGRTLRWKGREL